MLRGLNWRGKRARRRRAERREGRGDRWRPARERGEGVGRSFREDSSAEFFSSSGFKGIGTCLVRLLLACELVEGGQRASERGCEVKINKFQVQLGELNYIEAHLS